MITYNISLNKDLAQIVNRQIKIGKFANRSEFFRQLLRDVFLLDKKQDWIYDEPYYSELQERVQKLKSGQEELISAKEFDQEFNL